MSALRCYVPRTSQTPLRTARPTVADRSAHPYQSARSGVAHAGGYFGISLLHRAGAFGGNAEGADRGAGDFAEGEGAAADSELGAGAEYDSVQLAGRDVPVVFRPE